ncbi:nucleotide exchange factor GrpE [Desulfovibrio sulfodismutans]|uniref:Protein GrpE n=1 Tax=Desulfolutivibrio sulfodismutans TaxID=63561 RepID=A0A7K3NRN7_9BACT|nr:nucleotide exchange factor GrpE [Desulfolutivibrio sulfodismutans]NDY58850.1 nucleotide exchange factor GrpE [Desulfolutivibrio sulfodismutans]QLA10854.1 nucleotide exchange factor GrpE [Desulfolutivibrio sulfodismutans DSM 3696]
MEHNEEKNRMDAPPADSAGDSAALDPVQELARCREELAAESDRRLYILAESENLKKRLVKEKEEYFKYATESIVSELLPVLDNLDLALLHGRGNAGCKDLVMGVEMTRKAFVDILSRHGVEEFGTTGEEFNPEHHEAVGMEESSDVAENHVSRVLQKGYRLRGRLLRPAKVMVRQG